MDSWEGGATLEWWADRSTCLGRFGVRVTVRACGEEWTADAVMDPPPSEEGQEAFDLLTALDPLFTLCFEGDSTILVDVSTPVARGRLALEAHEPAAPGRVPR
ncbi:hypothetical protein ACFRKE_30070 [Kitasatospora indigofera]|uniref:hypothetical protein n=1 Tax=Kitasatospora indigofera TaxID=67307 RepID=UPI0036A906BF